MSNDREKEILSADEELFRKLQEMKKKRRRRIWLTVLGIVLAIAVALGLGVHSLRKRVQERFAAAAANVKSYEATLGTVSTTVSGTGVLGVVDEEQLTVPYGVELEEMLASVGESVKEGDALATVNMASVMKVLAETRDEITKLNDELNSAGNDAVSAYVTAGVGGRVKRICAEKGMNVVDCMSEHGALCVLSLDGCMIVEIDHVLSSEAKVTVVCSNGKKYPGKVERCVNGRSSITLTDNGPRWGDEVIVLTEEGEELGRGVLDIHSPLSVTGYAGTISGIYAAENQVVYAWSVLFTLSNTKYTANYDALLQSRRDAEARQLQLIGMLRTGAVTAPFDGTVISLDYAADGSSAIGSYYSATPTASGVLTMAPDEKMQVTLNVSESDILSLQVGQKAEVVVSSVSEDAVSGAVTEVDRTAVSASGVTLYLATVTLPKSEGMLAGMTAKTDIHIEGVENAVLIPVDAVHQTSERSFVYTSFDEESKQYGGMVDVTVGVSDGKYVEIISGLREGDRVYYTEKALDFFAMMSGFASSGNASSRPGGGGRPGGAPNGGKRGGA